MLRLALAGLRAHRIRTGLTVLAVTIGVSFLSGTLIYRDTATAALYQDLARAGYGVDVAVQRPGTEWSRWRGVDRSLLDRLRAVPGVATMDGRVVADLPLLDRFGRVLSNAGSPGVAVSLPAAGNAAAYTVSLFTLVAGRLPEQAGEVTVDRPTAQREHLSLGDTVRALDPEDHPHPLIVVGFAEFGPLAFAGFSALALTPEDLRSLTSATWFAQIAITAAPGTNPDRLRERIAAAVDPGYEVLTGQQLRDRLARASAKYVEGFLSAILASAIVALVVGCLVVYNTFSILTAHRVRELALLRCLGASRRQIVGLAAAEAAAIGVLASGAAVLLSLAAARGLLLARTLVAGTRVDHPLVVSPAAVAVAVGTGVAATVLSGLVPALTASRVSPLAAVQSAVEIAGRPRRPPGRRALRLGGAGLLAAGGVALTLSGVSAGFAGTPAVVGGAMLAFVALVAVLPMAMARLIAMLGWLPTRLFGLTGRLATANAQRNPRRAAATAIMLMIGVAVMSMFAVMLATARDQGIRELAENFPVDFVVEPVSHGRDEGPLPDPAVEAMRARPEFGAVARTRDIDAAIDGADAVIDAAEPGALGRVVVPEVLAGTLDQLGPGTVALRTRFAEPRRLTVGDVVRIGLSPPRSWNARVVALYDDAPTGGDALLTWTEFGRRLGVGRDRVLISRAEGHSAATARAALDATLRPFAFISVTSAAERRDSTAAELDERLVEFGGLLGISALIAIFGIMDTLALSVVERARESATLRALGLSAWRLRATLVVEALLMALVGGGIGVGFGTGFGWIAANGLIDVYGHGRPVVPVAQLAFLVAVAVGAGMLASVLPARRAARASVVAALVDT